MVAEMVPFEGNLAFSGFDPDGRGTSEGDPTLTDMVTKARLEFDKDKRRSREGHPALLGQAAVHQRAPGGANGLSLIWPVIKNYRVYQGGTFGDRDLWLDPNEAPLKKA